MKQPPVLIKSLSQQDNHTFVIEWSDGVTGHYRLSALQKMCPCAKCQNQVQDVRDDVRAVKVTNVGRYALRVQFTSGCSTGIYSFALLHALAR